MVLSDNFTDEAFFIIKDENKDYENINLILIVICLKIVKNTFRNNLCKPYNLHIIIQKIDCIKLIIKLGLIL